MYLLATCMSSLGKSIFKYIPHFYLGYLNVYYWVVWFLSIFWVLTSYQTCDWQILFSHSVGCFYLFKYLLRWWYWLFFFFCQILVPQPGIKPMPPALKAQSLNHWTTREVSLDGLFYFVDHFFFFFFDHFFYHAEAFSLMSSPLLVSALVAFTFGVIPQKLLAKINVKEFSPVFF